MKNDLTVGVISLGCDKNRVDTEKMLAILTQKYTLTGDELNADVIIINTCAFLESARAEAINEILVAIENKKLNPSKKIIVTGCLPQGFIEDIKDELLEVDAFLGISSYHKILEIIDRVLGGERVIEVTTPSGERTFDRVLTTKNHAYLKIADGCSNHCTYCLIPSIRGKYRSVESQDLVKEASSLGVVKELILVAQDTTRYGEDLTPKTSLVELIRKLSILPNVLGIRLLYCYPESITEELICEFRENAKLIRYIDIPFQHADDKILKLMNRKGTGKGYLELIEKLKTQVPGIAIRSTFITGFPGEGEKEFNTLLDFIAKAKLFNAGFFKYSRELGTPAYKLPNQVLAKEKNRRVRMLYTAQKRVVKEVYKGLLGKTFQVKAEGFDQNNFTYYGRAYFNAPDVDGKVYFFSADEVVYGEYYNVKITDSLNYDLIGERI